MLSSIKFAVQRLLGSDRRCEHTDQIRDVECGSEGCEQCIALGDSWVHLRMCMTCGQVGCCDSSVSLRHTNHLAFRAKLSPAGSLDLALVASRDASRL
jgi:hypothetical protein